MSSTAPADPNVVAVAPKKKETKKNAKKEAKKTKKAAKKDKVIKPETFEDVDDSEFTWIQKLDQNTCDTLNISRWRGKKSKTCPFDISALAKCLSKNRRLKVLFLGKNDIKDEGVKTIAEAIGNHPRLVRVSLDFNELTSDGVKTLMECMKSTTNMEYIDLSNNPIGDEGAKACADYLSLSNKLTILSLNNCNILHDGNCTLCEACKGNKTLESLSLSRNKLSKESNAMFAEMLSGGKNKTLGALSLLQTLITLEDSIKIKRSLRRNGKMKELFFQKGAFLLGTHSTLGGEKNESVLRTYFSEEAKPMGWDPSLIDGVWSFLHG